MNYEAWLKPWLPKTQLKTESLLLSEELWEDTTDHYYTHYGYECELREASLGGADASFQKLGH
jgi:hypothetical protein